MLVRLVSGAKFKKRNSYTVTNFQYIDLYIMYVDESGVEEHTDNTKYFIVSGVVVHESDLAKMKKMIQSIKGKIFARKFKGKEIHIHDIYKGKSDFYRITNE